MRGWLLRRARLLVCQVRGCAERVLGALMQAVQKVGLVLVVFVTIPFLLLAYWGDIQGLWGAGMLARGDVERVKISVEFQYDWPLACQNWERAGWDYNRMGQVDREVLGVVLVHLWEMTEGGRMVKATDDGFVDDRELVREFCDAVL